jgi:hypothetical protein
MYMYRRHPGEGRDPVGSLRGAWKTGKDATFWIPAFAGMTAWWGDGQSAIRRECATVADSNGNTDEKNARQTGRFSLWLFRETRIQ